MRRPAGLQTPAGRLRRFAVPVPASAVSCLATHAIPTRQTGAHHRIRQEPKQWGGYWSSCPGWSAVTHGGNGPRQKTRKEQGSIRVCRPRTSTRASRAGRVPHNLQGAHPTNSLRSAQSRRSTAGRAPDSGVPPADPSMNSRIENNGDDPSRACLLPSRIPAVERSRESTRSGQEIQQVRSTTTGRRASYSMGGDVKHR